VDAWNSSMAGPASSRQQLPDTLFSVGGRQTYGRDEVAGLFNAHSGGHSMQNDAGKGGAHTYLGAYALCLDTSSRLLLCRLNTGSIETGCWTLPGGGVQWGESPEDAVVRELQEETGLKPSEVRLVGHVFSEVYSATEARPGDPVHHVGLLYRVRELAGILRPEIAGTTDSCAWFTKEEAENLPLVSLARFAFCIVWSKNDAKPSTGRSAPCGDQALPGRAHPSPRSE
jgi:8-oxo-dGTP diphosphatase